MIWRDIQESLVIEAQLQIINAQYSIFDQNTSVSLVVSTEFFYQTTQNIMVSLVCVLVLDWLDVSSTQDFIMFWLRILMQWMLHIRLKLCSRFCIKIHLCQKPCHQREKTSFVGAFEEIQQSVPPPWRYLSILSCADQVILMCRQAQKQHLQWTSRWASNSCSLINGAKSILLYPKSVHIISFPANCLGWCFHRIIHRIWEIAPQKMTCCKPPQACGWGTINGQEVGCMLTCDCYLEDILFI